MKAFMASVLAIVVISVGASFALNAWDWSSETTYQTEDVRLD